MMNKRTAKAALLGAAIVFGLAGLSQAAGTTNNWWWQQSGATAGYNGAVTVKGSTGSSVTATSNPTGSAVNSRTTTATQPPVILQAAATHWLDPVSNYSSLPASGNQSGDVRLTLDNNRTFAWNGSAWAATAVDQNGQLAVGKLQINDVVTEGAGCSNNSLFAKDGNNVMLSCQSGTWKKAAGNAGKFWASEGAPGCSRQYVVDQWIPAMNSGEGREVVRNCGNDGITKDHYLCVNGTLGSILHVEECAWKNRN